MITDVGVSVDSSRMGDNERKRGERRALEVTVVNICRKTDGEAVLVESLAENNFKLIRHLWQLPPQFGPLVVVVGWQSLGKGPVGM